MRRSQQCRSLAAPSVVMARKSNSGATQVMTHQVYEILAHRGAESAEKSFKRQLEKLVGARQQI